MECSRCKFLKYLQSCQQEIINAMEEELNRKIDKALAEYHGTGNGRRLLNQLRR